MESGGGNRLLELEKEIPEGFQGGGRSPFLVKDLFVIKVQKSRKFRKESLLLPGRSLDLCRKDAEIPLDRLLHPAGELPEIQKGGNDRSKKENGEPQRGWQRETRAMELS
jgi:hypothetical protein